MNAPQPLALDAFRLEILSNALNAITEEIQLTLLRSAYSQVVKEAQDASCAYNVYSLKPQSITTEYSRVSFWAMFQICFPAF